MSIADDHGGWRAASVRGTAFVSVGADVRAAVSWEKLTGEVPDNIAENPKLRTFEESGQYESGVLVLKHDPGRVDLIHHPAVPEDPRDIDGFPVIGDDKTAIDRFRGTAVTLLTLLLESQIEISRLAFGAELLLPVGSHAEGYTLLNELLPSVEVDPTTTDFSYSVNRPRYSRTTDGLRLNRLSRWSLRRLALHVDSVGEISEFYACHLLLDINTVVIKGAPLRPGLLIPLFRELSDLGTEIADSGDVK